MENLRLTRWRPTKFQNLKIVFFLNKYRNHLKAVGRADNDDWVTADDEIYPGFALCMEASYPYDIRELA